MRHEEAYKILDLPVTASRDEIKKAYRKLSLKTHPDKCKEVGAGEKFAKLNEAYAILSGNVDESFLSPMSNSGSRQETVDIEEIFKMFATGQASNIFASMHRNLNKPIPIIKTIEITLEQAYEGCMIPLEVTRSTQSTNYSETEIIYIDVPAGTDSKEMIICRGKGNSNPDGVNGDVKVFIDVRKHDTFSRKGLDLVFKKKISLKEALCGFSFEINHLNGKVYKINNARGSIIGVGFGKTIANLGMRRKDKIGSLIIEFDLVMPDKLNENQISLIEKALENDNI
jgi:DnaJ-class molecular chaperone